MPGINGCRMFESAYRKSRNCVSLNSSYFELDHETVATDFIKKF